MPKRFTDTDIWDKEWFTLLSIKQKCLIRFIFDKCDASGMWSPNWVLASTYIGENVNEKDLYSISEQIQKTSSGKYWIPDFIKFQYGKLSRDCKPHIPIYKLLDKHGIDIDNIPMATEIGKTHNVSELLKVKILKRDDFTCCYCNKIKEERNLVIDHVVSRKRGGADTEDNLVAACVPCNSRKSDFSLDEFCERNHLDSETIKNRVCHRLSQRVSNTLKEKEKETEQERDKVLVNISFQTFWDLYDKKIGDKDRLEKKWNSLKDLDRDMIINHIPKYKDATPDKKFRKDPATYLNNKSWNDEIINSNGTHQRTFTVKQSGAEQLAASLKQDLRVNG